MTRVRITGLRACVLLIGLIFLGGCLVADHPAFKCFVDDGAWTPTGTTINDIARSTLGTIESCPVDHGGKPYYQMVLGFDSAIAAEIMAIHIEAWGLADSRNAWCSETISYWHRHAGLPYDRGYRNDTWHLTWQCPHSDALQTFYIVEENLSSGRGRWIEGIRLNYDDLRPGINAPAPGSYVLVRQYDEAKDTWDDKSHSMMIDEMTVYRDPAGNIIRVSVTLLEGNGGSDHIVRERPGGIDDLLDATLAGTTTCCGSRKIVGFGIDLDSHGEPIFDATRIHEKVETGSRCACAPTTTPAIIIDPLTFALIGYGSDLADTDLGIPNGTTTHRVFPKGTEWITYDIDLLQVHPLKITGVSLDWSDAGVPRDLAVQWAGDDGVFHTARTPWLALPRAGVVSEWHPVVPIPALFEERYPIPFEYYELEGQDVRYVRISVLPDTEVDLTLDEVLFFYVWDRGRDTDDEGMLFN